MMDEEICPNSGCGETFDKKLTVDSDRDFSVSAEHTDMEKVCVFHADGELWVYLHLATETVEETFEMPDDADQPVDLSGMVEEMTADGGDE